MPLTLFRITASVILGGIDTGKFKGKLVKRPLVKDELGTFGQVLKTILSFKKKLI
jgi:hypothetical protein